MQVRRASSSFAGFVRVAPESMEGKAAVEVGVEEAVVVGKC